MKETKAILIITLGLIYMAIVSILTLGLFTSIELTYNDDATEKYANIYSFVYQKAFK